MAEAVTGACDNAKLAGMPNRATPEFRTASVMLPSSMRLRQA